MPKDIAPKPTLGRVVWYRHTVGSITQPADIVATVDTLKEAGKHPVLSTPTNVHLLVKTMNGVYNADNVPYWDPITDDWAAGNKDKALLWSDADQQPGTWTWPRRES